MLYVWGGRVRTEFCFAHYHRKILAYAVPPFKLVPI